MRRKKKRRKISRNFRQPKEQKRNLIMKKKGKKENEKITKD